MNSLPVSMLADIFSKLNYADYRKLTQTCSQLRSVPFSQDEAFKKLQVAAAFEAAMKLVADFTLNVDVYRSENSEYTSILLMDNSKVGKERNRKLVRYYCNGMVVRYNDPLDRWECVADL